MSKRHSLFHGILTKLIAVTALFLAMLFASSPPASAQSWYGYPAVDISYPGVVALGSSVSLDVGLLEDSVTQQPIGGFNLLITYDPQALTFIGASSGTLLDSAGWESFQYQQGQLLPGKYFIRLTAVADLNNGSHHPSGFLMGKTGQLALLRFQVTSDSAAMFHKQTPLDFFWTDCGDNTLTSVNNDSLFYEYAAYGSECFYCSQPTVLGTGKGAPDSCLTTSGGRVPDRLFSFFGSVVSNAPPDSIDTRGDLNLNGIANEIADLVQYANYFLHGLESWPTYNLPLEIATSDVNADGKTLTYRDYVYLNRIVVGDALPISGKSAAANLDATFFQDTVNHRVEVTFPSGNLAGAFMLVQGNITPVFTLPFGWNQDYYFDGSFTRILFLGRLDSLYNNGIWFTYSGEGKLRSVETTDWFNSNVTAHITGVGAGFSCGDPDGSGGLDISDAVYLVSYIFAGGQPPLDINGGDVNCDGVCDISDVVYLVTWIFAGGVGPCAGCK